MPTVFVPPERFERFVANFGDRHGWFSLDVDDEGLVACAENGAGFRARLPFDEVYSGPAVVADFIAAVTVPKRWGVLLVRKGGFALAHLSRSQVDVHHVGRRHMQSRSAAGGQSQQRFARRRQNQARAAFEAAADYAVRILGPTVDVVTGGDAAAVAAVLADPRLAHLKPCGPFLTVADPRRAVLDQAVSDAMSIHVQVWNEG